MTLQQLLKFYLACIETEDRQALCKKLSALHHSMVSPWNVEERLFSRGEYEIEFETFNATEQNLLSRSAAIAGDPERFYYGYPLFLYRDQGDWYLSPLFMQEVEVAQQERGRYLVQAANSDGIELNQHLFQKQHVHPEELREIAHDLEGAFGSFRERVEAAFQAMALPCPSLNPIELDPWPQGQLTHASWVNRPILFKSERSIYTIHLKRELELLGSDPNLQTKIAGTSFSVFFNTTTSRPLPPDSPISLVQVMPLNKGQEDAARAALLEPITVVTGPPGTGKSQVVVNLLASCALAGKPALFASKNNKAVDVVRQRLRALLGDQQDWVLRLGNRKMMEECRQEMDGRLAGAANITAETLPSPEVLHHIDIEIDAIRKNLQNLSVMQNELRAFDRERRVLESTIDGNWVRACEGWAGETPQLERAERSRRLSDQLANEGSRGLRVWFLRTILRKRTARRLREQLTLMSRGFPYEISANISTINVAEKAVFATLADAFRKIIAFGEWRHAVAKVDQKLEAISRMESAKNLVTKLEDLQAQRSEMSAAQFRVGWTQRIKKSPTHHRLSKYFDLVERAYRLRGGEAAGHVATEWARQVATVGSDLPIWIVTNLSARRALPLHPGLFDLLIIDEASQCDIPSAIPLLFRARRALIIGDPHQLRHISTLRTADEMKLAAQFGIQDFVTRWSYNQRSLYNLAEEIATNIGKPVGFLAEHYRSHPEIVEFSNKSFYSGRLVLRTRIDKLKEKTGDHSLGVFWHDTPGAVPHSSRSACNDAEVEGVLNLLSSWSSMGFLYKKGLTFGVVTPFRLQMEKLRESIARMPWWDRIADRLTVGTAHRFQGDECDIMIFSPVVAGGMLQRLVRWVADTDQLLNVAITRARAALHVVGDMQASLAAGGRLGDFAASVQAGIQTSASAQPTESPAEQAVADMLQLLGIWYKSQYPMARYRLDFLVVSPMGIKYDLEVDGRGHLTDEAVRADEIRDTAIEKEGLKIVRIDARLVFSKPETVRAILSRIC
jgi:very-short-patch-repair endonuclease